MNWLDVERKAANAHSNATILIRVKSPDGLDSADVEIEGVQVSPDCGTIILEVTSPV
jgi:hypothetical protein